MVRCPKCKNTFRAEEEDSPEPTKKANTGLKKPGAPAGKPRHREDDLAPAGRGKQDEPRGSRARESGGNKTVLILSGLGAVLLLTGGILIATGVFSSNSG